MSKQMTKKQAIDLLATLTFISVSKNGEQVIEKIGLTEEQTDKMMRVVVSLFNNDEVEANKFIIKEMKKLLKKLDEHDDSDAKESTFKRTGDGK
ncbi:hypothetical protein OB446_027090 [Paenibacillus alvei]|uniref:hypothetical protein n=1 Tax=Paenibacillus alvei TaxID=44250 RepID=UPI0002894354|nr:hypothetical protein [Paenibacillus alvei]EJW13944.1 hypothetical protein PAV_141p00500 [Paenibacillus alvei DSM 29]MCY9707694.1 hypothetical protein [Paenibacillus alvei]MEC0082793.1 hypothetical protein [Paenibacillus alvei]